MSFEAFDFFIIIIILKLEFVRLIGRTDGIDLPQMFELIDQHLERVFLMYCSSSNKFLYRLNLSII